MAKNDSQNDKIGRYVAACLQYDVQRGDVSANLIEARTRIESAAEARAKLLVLPEMWSTSFLSEYDDAIVAEAAEADRELLRLSRELGAVLVFSSLEQSGDVSYNTARVFDCGTELGSYRKIHLFSPNAENRFHRAGERPLVIDTSAGKMGVLICYDIRFPELVRYYFHAGAELLVVPAQWPEARSTHWRTLLRARAIENELFVLGCNRTGSEPSLKTDEMLVFPGDSRIVDPMGEVLAAGAGETDPILAEIELRKVRSIRRIIPVDKDQRPGIYKTLFDESWSRMLRASREGQALGQGRSTRS